MNELASGVMNTLLSGNFLFFETLLSEESDLHLGAITTGEESAKKTTQTKENEC